MTPRFVEWLGLFVNLLAVVTTAGNEQAFAPLFFVPANAFACVFCGVVLLTRRAA